MVATTPAQPVGQKDILLKATPTYAGGSYSAGQCVGGPMQFANAVSAGANSGVVNGASLIDGSAQNIELELWLFSANPTTGTGTYVDAEAFNPSFADLQAMFLGIIDFAASDYAVGGGHNANVCEEGNLSQPISTNSDSLTSVWGLLVARGSATYAASKLAVNLRLAQD